MQQLNGFLGSTVSGIKADNLYVALNSYYGNREFEDWHTHANASVSFLLDGSYSEDLTGKTYKRTPGDIKFIAADELHRCNNYKQGTRKINIELPGDLLQSLDVNQDDIENTLATHQQSKFTLLKIYRELSDQPNVSAASMQLLLYELLHPSSGEKTHHRHAPLWVSRLKELLAEQYTGQLNLAEIAAILNVHPVTISRYFPVYFDVTLSEYLRNIRVEKALSLIKGTQKSLTEIGLTCGFADQSHFTHTFKKVTGYLPKEYRSI